MTRLSLVGPSDDGLHLVVESESGDRFEIPLTDELRHAVRYTRPAMPAVEPEPETPASSMSPREVQQRIRGGLTAAELAELTGAPLASIEKYERPVVAERRYIADLARETRIGRDPSAPVLGELVTDRLAARGVDPESVMWDAWREVDEPWKVAADYTVSGRGVRALWTFDHTARTVTAEDEEARWLSETELLDVPIPRRHLAAVREEQEAAADKARPLIASRPPVPTEPATSEIVLPLETVSATELLLEDLEMRRGTRESVDEDDAVDEDDEVFEGFGPQRARQAETAFGPRGGSPHPASAPASSTPAPRAAVAPEPSDRRGASAKRGRASVPSWDEIVFGAKNDQG